MKHFIDNCCQVAMLQLYFFVSELVDFSTHNIYKYD